MVCAFISIACIFKNFYVNIVQVTILLWFFHQIRYTFRPGCFFNQIKSQSSKRRVVGETFRNTIIPSKVSFGTTDAV